MSLKHTSSKLKALAQAVLAAGPLLRPPLGPAIQPKISAMLARVLAATPACKESVCASPTKKTRYHN